MDSACSVFSVEEWREKERIKRQEVDKEVVLEEKAGKELNGFAVGEEDWAPSLKPPNHEPMNVNNMECQLWSQVPARRVGQCFQ